VLVQSAAQPLSRFQWLMWSGQKLNPQAAIYTNAGFGVIARRLDRRCFAQAVQALVERCDALRTVVEEEEGVPVQRVLPELAYTPLWLDLSDRPDPRAAAERWSEERARTALDITSRPFEIALLKLSDEEYGLYSNFHHLVTDAWSVAILERLLSDCYAHAEAGTLDDVAAQPSFAEHVRAQRQLAESPQARKAMAFWREALAGDHDLLRFYGQRPATGVTPVERVTCAIGADRSAALRALVSSRPDLFGTTSDLSLHHLFATLVLTFLHHIGDRAGSVALGLPFHNRRDRQAQETVGCLMQILPLRLDVDPGETFATLLGKVSQRYLSILRHRHYEVGNPLHKRAYDAEFNFINRRPPAQLFDRPRVGRWLHPGHGVDALCVQVYFDPSRDSFVCEFDFDATLFDESRRARAIDQFLRVIDGALTRLDQPIADLCLLSEDERQQVLTLFRAPDNHDLPAPLPLPALPILLPLAKQSFDTLFTSQVRATPQRTAVSAAAGAWTGGVVGDVVGGLVAGGEAGLTYEALDQRVTRAAARLRQLGVGPESVVALLSRRSIDFLTSMLAIFRVGAAYTPLDPLHPIDRLAAQLRLSGSTVCLLSDDLLASLPATAALPSDCRLEPLSALAANGSDAFLAAVPYEPHRLSYVIYTSGSTGTPKGAMVEEQGMVNHLLAKIHDLQLTQDSIVAQTASQCSDISVWQFLAALLVGGEVRILDDRIVRDAEALLQTVETRGVTVLELVPSQLRALLDAIDTSPDLAPPFRQLRCLMPTGELLEPELVRRWFARWPDIPLVNAYGPAECSDDVTHHRIASSPTSGHHAMPIGRALANLRVYVLDGRLQPCPLGLVGEIYVGGVGVGRGYLADPVRSSASFVPDPFAPDTGARMYRTGDVGRYLPSGELVFLGRVDHQVKIRGFRVEVAEVETALRAHPAIADVVVTPIASGSRGTRLAAYCVFNDGASPSAADLRRFIQRTLPAYMVPAAFVAIAAMPLTANGKIDRKRLPAPQWTDVDQEEPGTPPATALETQLAAIWSEVLGIADLTVERNFFELGGDSILLMLVVTRAKRAGMPLDQEDLFRHPTIASLAAHLDTAAKAPPAQAQDLEDIDFEWSDEERAAIDAALGQA
jgi:amino acid adenylation domain-containing protein